MFTDLPFFDGTTAIPGSPAQSRPDPAEASVYQDQLLADCGVPDRFTLDFEIDPSPEFFS